MTVNSQFANLEPEVQRKFIDIANKDPEGRSPAEWFEHLVPEELQDSSTETQVFMDGGEVTKEVWVDYPGAAGGRWETVEFEIADRDVSRRVSGHNGGEYTMDNTIMEDSSINRSRGAENMTESEFELAQEANAADAHLIDNTTDITETMSESPEVLGEALGTVADVAIAGIAAYKVGEYTYNNLPADWSETDKKVATGGAAIGTAALAFTPPGQFVIGVYAAYKLFCLGYKAVRKFA